MVPISSAVTRCLRQCIRLLAGDCAAEPEQLIEIAKICEEVGFEGVMVSDHLFHPQSFENNYPYNETGDPGFTPDTPWPQAWTTIAAMSAASSSATAVHTIPV